MRTRHRVAALAALAAGLAWFVRPAWAGCTVDAGGGVAFGAYSPFDTAPLDSTGTITLNCTSPYSSTVLVELSAGLATGFAPRELQSGTHRMTYNLFLDAGRTSVWGDGTSGTSYSTQSPADGVDLNLTVFGRIPARQNAWVGAYADSVVVTVEF